MNVVWSRVSTERYMDNEVGELEILPAQKRQSSKMQKKEG